MDDIVGAGLSGLIAAHLWRGADVYDAMPEPNERHTALLRFRTPDIGNLVGIEFKRVKVRKGIFAGGKFREPSIELANLYSEKVTGRYTDRSIWNLEPVERFIAPEDFYWRMLDNVGNRVMWNTKYDFVKKPRDVEVINTAPLPQVCATLGLPFPEASYSPISSARYTLHESKGVDLYQTVYFPVGPPGIYRISISGSTIIAESADAQVNEEDVVELMERAFGMLVRGYITLSRSSGGNGHQGKVTPVDSVARRSAIHHLTTHHRVFSFGRYGTWRNILLDDLIKDAAAINHITRSDMYGTRLLQR